MEPRLDVVWKYLPHLSVKHAFDEIGNKTSICNRSTAHLAYVTWQTDEAGLKERRKCENCVLRLENQ